jgi:hypothetical protein
MRCGIAKWLVSAARDRRRDLPRPVKRHVERCASCREFARFTRAVSEAAGRDARAFLEKVPAPETGGFLDRSPARKKPAPAFPREARRPWVPASVAAAGLVLAALLILRPAGEKPTPDEVAEFKKLAFAGGAVMNLAAEAQSPLDREYESLKKSVDSACQTVLASLDFKIEPEAPRGRAGRSST